MNIGFVAHDAKKKLMQNCCIAYRGILVKHDLYATGTTGRLIEEATGMPVHKFLAGQIRYPEITEIIRHCMETCRFLPSPSLDEIFETEREVDELVAAWHA